MKIGVISTTVFQVPIPGYGGLEVIAWECARGLAAKGHEVFLFAPDGSTCPNVTIVPFGVAGTINEQMAYGGYPEEKNQQGQLTRRSHGGYWQQLLQMDCIIDHSWEKNAYALKMEGRLKAPVLSVMHAPVNTMISSMPPGVEKPCFVCISQDQATHFEALFERPAKVAYNGIDTNHYRSMEIDRTDRYLFLARYSSIKGPDLAIQACLAANTGLDLIGDTQITNEPEYFQQCMHMAQQQTPFWRGEGKQIRVQGGIPRGETVFWYSQAHCMLHLNMRFREPFGLAPVEAMACGCPVIAWKRGAMPETIVDGETGYLVESLDQAIETMKEFNELSDAERKVMREAAVDRAQSFTIGHMVEKYQLLCEEAVATGGW